MAKTRIELELGMGDIAAPSGLYKGGLPRG